MDLGVTGRVAGRGGGRRVQRLVRLPVMTSNAALSRMPPRVAWVHSGAFCLAVSPDERMTCPVCSTVAGGSIPVWHAHEHSPSPHTDQPQCTRTPRPAPGRMQVVAATSSSYGCNSTEVQWSPVPYPPTVNDATLSALVADVGNELAAQAEALAASATPADHSSGGHSGGSAGEGGGGVRVFLEPEPSMAAEDFSFYGREVPAAFTWLGIGGPGTDVALHNSRFEMDEGQMALGAALHAGAALEFLHRRAAEAGVGGAGGAASAGAGAGGRDEL